MEGVFKAEPKEIICCVPPSGNERDRQMMNPENMTDRKKTNGRIGETKASPESMISAMQRE